MRADEVPADPREVLARGDEAGEQLVGECPGLVATAGRAVVGGAHLVRAPPLEQLATAERDPEVGAVELVRRAEQDVCTGRGDVDRAVRRVMHGVHPCERAGLVRERRDLRDGCHRADAVRGPRERDDARSLREQRAQVVEIEPAFGVELAEPDDEALVVRELEPR